MSDETSAGPHRGQPVLTTGAPLTEAAAAMIMVHGRGATAESILTLAAEFERPDIAYLAPQAVANTWYPYSFLALVEQNEPWLSSALATVGRALDAVEQAGFPAERTFLLGFSQGACLSLEYVARNPQRYAGVAGLSGGVIGPLGSERKAPPGHPLDGTPIFLGCSDVDPHIPVERVHETTVLMRAMGAAVTERIYRGMGHTINQDEIDHIREMLHGSIPNSVET
jgi:phospholipase/carboxylesterase